MSNKRAIDPRSTPVSRLPGVGPERAAQLARLEIHTAGDLLLHPPRRYEDRRRLKKIGELEMGVATVTFGRIVAAGVKTWRQRTKSIYEFILEDGTGRLHCRWWNLPYMQNYFKTGDVVLVYGKVKSLKPRTIDHPDTEVVESGEEISIHLNRIVPVYPLTEGLPQRWLRSLIWRAIEEYGSGMAEPYPEIPLPDMPSCQEAVRSLHFPEELEHAKKARERLALDEFIDLQIAIQNRRKKLAAAARGLPCSGTNELIKKFLAQLDFRLTGAQTRVLREIRHDISGGPRPPMRRLLQGDVGSGKTIVAACSALMALESGFSVAVMAPTEILAEQHYQTFRRWLDPLNARVELLTGSRKTVELRTRTVEGQKELGLAAPEPSRPGVFVGTHALIEEAFAPENLGLVIIDEQHKFGVTQRDELVRKGRYPHVLVMTATPIPRTLGLTLYGDLDISVIDELPGGRGEIRTYVRPAGRLPKVWEFIRQKLGEGRQAYIVYPRVEEADLGAGIKAVTREFENVQKQIVPFRAGLLHGRMRAEEKEEVMAAFRANRIHALLSTTVIEVGVDVPNATVMLIESAEQFGLAQLHQLRGRIGRGAHESHCILVASAKTEEARKRLQVMEQTRDGFKIAEADMRLRGPGELVGQAQSGLPPFRFGDLIADATLVERARELVRAPRLRIQ